MTPAERDALSKRVGFAVPLDDREALEELAKGIELWVLHFAGMTRERDDARTLGEQRVQAAIDLLVRMQRSVADETLPPCAVRDCRDFAHGFVPLCKSHIVETVEGPNGPARAWTALGIHPTRAPRT